MRGVAEALAGEVGLLAVGNGSEPELESAELAVAEAAWLLPTGLSKDGELLHHLLADEKAVSSHC